MNNVNVNDLIRKLQTEIVPALIMAADLITKIRSSELANKLDALRYKQLRSLEIKINHPNVSHGWVTGEELDNIVDNLK